MFKAYDMKLLSKCDKLLMLENTVCAFEGTAKRMGQTMYQSSKAVISLFEVYYI